MIETSGRPRIRAIFLVGSFFISLSLTSRFVVDVPSIAPGDAWLFDLMTLARNRDFCGAENLHEIPVGQIERSHLGEMFGSSSCFISIA
ncbi:hypothetical protein [Bradyrhizobium canariense]|uniref:hypothetical protein n=1 Tax=Bradyrhizobium canariense TaxID=255045 RepID=UPI001431EA5A|nr:hypothetical protein [Bradyrhizobium canariense]